MLLRSTSVTLEICQRNKLQPVHSGHASDETPMRGKETAGCRGIEHITTEVSEKHRKTCLSKCLEFVSMRCKAFAS